MSQGQLFYNANQQEYTNTWISMNYCKSWDIWEGIRELLQNQMDGVTSLIGKSNIQVIPLDPAINGVKYQFNFIHKDTEVGYGQILYNQVNSTLTIWNKGKLETGDLLLGGTKDIVNSEEIIGRFGEGMKLAALAFVRKNKRFSIITDGKLWTFIQKSDPNFIKNGQPQLCLHWKGEDCNIADYANKVTIEISPFSLDEWIPYIDNFLWLTQRHVGRIDAKDSNGKIIGQLLYNDFFKYKIYVKDIFVQETEKEEPNNNHGATNCYFGFNTDLVLDRDRNAVKNLDERNQKFSQILGDIMNRRNSNEIIENLEGEERLNFLNKYPGQIVYLLEGGFYTCYYINNYLTTESRDALYNQKISEDLQNRAGKNIIYSPYLGYFQHWIAEKKLPPSFYPYFLIGSTWLWGVLTKSSLYKPYEQKYKEKILSSPEVNEPPSLKNVIDTIVQIIRNVNPNFVRNNIKFKSFGNEFQDDVVCFNNNIIYFSDKLGNMNIDRIKKFWMLESVCHFFKINAMKLLINSSNLFR